MKIYTKTGDTGKTSLIGGTRVFKYDSKVEAYGTIDELNSYIGLIRDYDIDEHTKFFLIDIQSKLFIAESIVTLDSTNKNVKIPVLLESDIIKIESEIDNMNDDLETIENFVLPGGHIVVSLTHVARTICRRAERRSLMVLDKDEMNEQELLVLKYLNRLSDYLFVLSRKFAKDFNAVESIWQPNKKSE